MDGEGSVSKMIVPPTARFPGHLLARRPVLESRVFSHRRPGPSEAEVLFARPTDTLSLEE